jgi:hypothetical protein
LRSFYFCGKPQYFSLKRGCLFLDLREFAADSGELRLHSSSSLSSSSPSGWQRSQSLPPQSPSQHRKDEDAHLGEIPASYIRSERSSSSSSRDFILMVFLISAGEKHGTRRRARNFLKKELVTRKALRCHQFAGCVKALQIVTRAY